MKHVFSLLAILAVIVLLWFGGCCRSWTEAKRAIGGDAWASARWR
jgi:hypothetical protein